MERDKLELSPDERILLRRLLEKERARLMVLVEDEPDMPVTNTYRRENIALIDGMLARLTG